MPKLTFKEKEIDTKELRSNYFSSEKHLQNFIYDNIEKFIADVFNDTVIAARLEVPLTFHGLREDSRNQSNGYGKRIDIEAQGQNCNYLIEVKKPHKNSFSTVKGIGQILDYGRLYQNKHKLVMVSSTYDLDTQRTIEYYELPIIYIYLDEKQIAFKEFNNG